VHQNRICADDVADGRQEAGTGAVGQPCGTLQKQRCLVPHQLAAPHAVRGASDGADVVPPDLGRGEVGLALVERVEQPQDRLVAGVGEPLTRLRRLAGGRQILEELLWLTGDTGRAQRLDQQGASAALRREHEIGRRGCHAQKPNRTESQRLFA
jgi:hypothetical protein